MKNRFTSKIKWLTGLCAALLALSLVAASCGNAATTSTTETVASTTPDTTLTTTTTTLAVYHNYRGCRNIDGYYRHNYNYCRYYHHSRTGHAHRKQWQNHQYLHISSARSIGFCVRV